MGILKRLVDTEYKELKRFKKIADEIEALDEEYTKMTDEELSGMTEKLRKEGKVYNAVTALPELTVNAKIYKINGNTVEEEEI